MVPKLAQVSKDPVSKQNKTWQTALKEWIWEMHTHTHHYIWQYDFCQSGLAQDEELSNKVEDSDDDDDDMEDNDGESEESRLTLWQHVHNDWQGEYVGRTTHGPRKPETHTYYYTSERRTHS